MNSTFGNVFLFLTDLAWKNRFTLPVLVTTAFLVMDLRLQIEINVQTGQVDASDTEDGAFEIDAYDAYTDDEGSELYTDEEYTIDSSDESLYNAECYDDNEDSECYWSSDSSA
ncbi:uncharacterized protein LOC115632045 [Scaptodrosophila lebanonensis]|uniref:Uncharacterized protein LOC115632045 n=1 Tax=Drosophila lebanonensis TaxID=7225 RepID=A0A6J2U8R0_DROLE|nr:uncharacterized protein LOC115632045 [Scaptodrosophila lebanonensis]